MSKIVLKNIVKKYPNAKWPAVYDISFSVEKGEVLSLLGPSGSGKTTLLRLIAGFEAPDSGTILLDGREVSGPGKFLPPEQRGIGMVFQDGGIFPHLNVQQNIGFGLYRHQSGEKEKKVLEMMRIVGLSGLENRYPHELSGGQQQRVALARAMAMNPVVLLLDEPFSSLAPDMRSKMREEVHQILKEIGATAIFVTHDHEEAFAMADKVAVLNVGRLEQMDTPEMIYHLPQTPFVADFVGQADFIKGEIKSDGLIHTEMGHFQNQQNRDQGAGIVVMVRPDDVHIVPDFDGSATILSKQFRGSENLYEISLASGQIVHGSENSLALYPVGTKVRIELTATHTVVFRADALAKEVQ
ncbi:MAG: ABC transporter ATP-binding protein [Nitrospirota bacterium]